MVKVKASKRLLRERNLLRIAQRWASRADVGQLCEGSGEQSDASGPSYSEEKEVNRPSTSASNIQLEPEEEEEEEGECSAKPEKPTGFALYTSYRPQANIVYDNNTQYILVDLQMLSDFLASFPCRECFQQTVSVTNKNIKGFASTLNLLCSNCGEEAVFHTSGRVATNESTRQAFDVNRRVVKAFTSMGKGHRALQQFCIAMDMKPIQFESYNKHVLALQKAYKAEVDKTLDQARNEVRKCYSDLNEDETKILDITVSFDGSWQKRGFTSKYGIGCCIEVVTGLVIDYEVLSKYCKQCEKMKAVTKGKKDHFDKWYVAHRPKCQCNYSGSSPGMEIAAAEKLWNRSESLGFRYTTLVSDGDAKTQTHLNEIQVYKETTIEKVECLNHVAKRLGTGLRNLVQKYVGTDEKMGGKGRGNLTEPVIKKLTRYYRNGITQNLGDVKKMKDSIFTTLDHCQSTDKKPQHEKCPTGESSWCFYQRAIAKKIKPESHTIALKTPLTKQNVEKMMPLYERLSSDSLLERCLAGKTNNANEALHNIVWSKCPKTVFTSRVKIEIGVCEAISIYNTGYFKTTHSFQNAVGISPGRHAAQVAKTFDKKRLRLSSKRKSLKYDEYRRRLKIAQAEEEERLQRKEGLTYGAGCF